MLFFSAIFQCHFNAISFISAISIFQCHFSVPFQWAASTNRRQFRTLGHELLSTWCQMVVYKSMGWLLFAAGFTNNFNWFSATCHPKLLARSRCQINNNLRRYFSSSCGYWQSALTDGNSSICRVRFKRQPRWIVIKMIRIMKRMMKRMKPSQSEWILCHVECLSFLFCLLSAAVDEWICC